MCLKIVINIEIVAFGAYISVCTLDLDGSLPLHLPLTYAWVHHKHVVPLEVHFSYMNTHATE